MLKSDADPQRCQAYVHDSGRSVSFHQCLNKPTVTRSKQRYCGLHDPVAVEQRREMREAKWKTEWKNKEDRWKKQEERNRFYIALVAHLKKMPEIGWEDFAMPWLRKCKELAETADKLGL